jgi:hypothetical protein
MYEKQIEQLIILQQLDEEIIVLEEEKERAPQEVAELETQHQAIQDQLAQIEEKIGLLKEQQKRLDGEIEDDSLKIKKSKNKLMMASNSREYQAMMREMDNLEKLNRLREEESAALTEELGRQRETRDEIRKQADSIAEELAGKRENIDQRLSEIQGSLDKLNAKRKKACEVIPKPILSRYEFIRSRLENPVIVPVDVGVCNGCHIAIPPQTYNELQRGKQIHSCPNCQRLIFWREHGPEETKKEAAEAEQA